MEQERPVNQFFRFEELRIYHKALDYVCWVHKKTRDFQDSGEIVRGYSRAAQSIAINIAEGSNRNKTQFIYYLKMAKSSIRECYVFSVIAKNLDYFNEEQMDESRAFLIEMTKMVGALITSLQRSQRNNSHQDEVGDEEEEGEVDFNKADPPD